MGAVAAQLSDIVIGVTSDNPRSENPDGIIGEIKRGIVMPPDRMKGQTGAKRRPTLHAIADRRAAIERAVHEARSGDRRSGRQRAREMPGDRRSRAAVRRRRGGKGCPGPAPRRVSIERRVALTLTAAGIAQASGSQVVQGIGDAHRERVDRFQVFSRGSSSSRFAAIGSTGTTSFRRR